MTRRFAALLLSLPCLLFARTAPAELQIPSVIGSHMVLQREAVAAVWGWHEPGTAVTVRFRGRKVTATTGKDGKFLIHVPTGKAGGPFTLTVAGSETKTIEDVLVGEVWLAGGQSNMWWQMMRARDAETEIAAAVNLPAVRFYDGNTHPREGGWREEEPKRDIPKARWDVPTEKTVPKWASTAYFFARDLHAELGVPVGIVHIAVPGQKIQLFMDADQTARNLPGVWAQHEAAVAAHPDKVAAHEKKLAEWRAQGEESKKPKAPRMPLYEAYWNGMVLPVAPFTVKGIIWWQGESNANEAAAYEKLLPELARQWRTLWGNPAMPFIQVELANFGPPSVPTVSQDAPWPQLREAQRRASSDADGIYLVSVIDIKEDPPGEAHWQIHPARKQIAGERLFRAAMQVAYGETDTPGFGPRLQRAVFEDGRVLLHFDSVGRGLQSGDDEGLTGFGIAGPDGTFHAADVETVDNDTLKVSSDELDDIRTVRYNWANNPKGNLVNSEGMPAGAFEVNSAPGPKGDM